MACAACNALPAGSLPNGDCTCAVRVTLPNQILSPTASCAPSPCGDRSAFTQLTPAQASSSAAQRIMRSQDRARQSIVRLGFRPYNVNLVWVQWTGAHRGDGHEKIYQLVKIVPSPKLIDLSAISMSPVATGILPMGSIRLDKISGCYTSDQLAGRLRGDAGTPQPFDFYYDVFEDGRSGVAEHMKFRPASAPMRRSYGWSVSLERIGRDGPRDGSVTDPVP